MIRQDEQAAAVANVVRLFREDHPELADLPDDVVVRLISGVSIADGLMAIAESIDGLAEAVRESTEQEKA